MLGNRGFGHGYGDGGYGYGGKGCDSCCTKELELINDNMNSRFNDLNYEVNHSEDIGFQRGIFKELCDVNSNIVNNVNALSAQTASGFYNTAIGLKDAEINQLKCCCETKEAIAGTNRNIDQLRFDDALGFCQTQKQLSDCCCTIERGQDQIRFEAAQNTCAIMANDTANAQKIIDKMTCNEIQELRDKLQNQKFENSQLMQNTFLVNQLRPCPVPAYPSCNPWGCNSFNGFDGFNRFDGRRDGFRDGGCCGCI